jgi:hypothetical protein
MRKKQRGQAEPAEPVEAATPEREAHETVLQLVQRFNTDEWQGKKAYLYRVWPVIDRKADDHFIARLSEPFDEDYLLKNWGSGRYHLRLNDAQGHTIATQNVSVHNPAHPPKVDPAEVVESDPRNKTYFETWGPRAAKENSAVSADGAAVGELARLAGKVLDQKTLAPPPASGLTEATTQLVLGMSKGRDELAEKLATLTSGTDSVTSLKGAIELLKQLQPQSDPIDALTRAVDLVKKLQPAPRTSPEKTPVEQVSEMLDLMSKLKDNLTPSAPSGEGSSSDLGSIAAIVHEVADLLKNPLAIATQMWAASKAHTPSVPPPITTTAAPSLQRAQPQSSTAPTPPPSPAPSAQPQTGPAAAAPPTQSGTGPTPAPPPQDSVIALANWITPIMLRWLHDDARGGEIGAGFAGWLADGWGVSELEALQAAGSDTIVELYRQSPVWMILAPMESKFREFVQAFVEWQPDNQQDDTNADDDDDREVATATLGL